MQRILLAGRDSLLGVPLRESFKNQGYDYILCTRLSDAVAVILENPPDFLVVELGFDGNRDLEIIKASKACLQKANMPILLVLEEEFVPRLDWLEYAVDDILLEPFTPELFLARILLAESRMNRVFDNNPLTRLPGNTSVMRAIQKTLESEIDFAVGYVDIDNFKPYNDRYGFSRGDEVIIMTSRIIVNVIEELARDGGFVGHIGGDDFVFIVRREKIQAVCGKIISNFELVRNLFLSHVDIEADGFVGVDRQGNENRFGLLSLSIAAITTTPGRYGHYGEVVEAASQVKSIVKKQEGSVFMVDRRNAE